MNIVELRIFKIDLEKKEVEEILSSSYGKELITYLTELFNTIILKSMGRKFTFESSTTEVRQQITRITNNADFSKISKIIAERLLRSELFAQSMMMKLGVSIQKGILVQAKVTENNQEKFIICKTDHNDFLDEITFQLARGLPVKKKAFKAFVCNYYANNSVDEILVYDTNPDNTKYWWKDLLELTEVFSDEDNTERAFKAIDIGVFSKIKKNHPVDYTHLRNSTVRYFRSNEKFDMDDFLDNGLGNYDPYDSKFNLDELKLKIKELPQKKNAPFDTQFNIIKQKIKARFVRTVSLTAEIDLLIKGDIAENTILTEIGKDGLKYVKIKSDDGYQFFQNNENGTTE